MSPFGAREAIRHGAPLGLVERRVRARAMSQPLIRTATNSAMTTRPTMIATKMPIVVALEPVSRPGDPGAAPGATGDPGGGGGGAGGGGGT